MHLALALATLVALNDVDTAILRAAMMVAADRACEGVDIDHSILDLGTIAVAEIGGFSVDEAARQVSKFADFILIKMEERGEMASFCIQARATY